MQLEGTVHEGVVVLDRKDALPEGTRVGVIPLSSDEPASTVGKGLPDRVVAAKLAGPSSVQLVFADGLSCTANIRDLGIAADRFDASSLRPSEDGAGIEVRRSGRAEWATFDGSSLRCRVDAEYAKRIRAELDALYIPLAQRLTGNPPPAEWHAEDHGELL